MSVAVVLALVLPGLATWVGGLVLLGVRDPSERLLGVLLGLTSGVMLGAVASLLVPAVRSGPVLAVAIGAVAGIVLLRALDRRLPHAHARLAEPAWPVLAEHPTRVQPALLLTAMTIHNLPEGLAVGAAFASGGWSTGFPLAVAIELQNVPEGFAAAAPLVQAGTSPRHAARIAGLTGLVEPPAALVAYATFGLVDATLVPGLAFAAGAMLYVTIDELIPESRAHGHQRDATFALGVGLLVMVALETLLGG